MRAMRTGMAACSGIAVLALAYTTPAEGAPAAPAVSAASDTPGASTAAVARATPDSPTENYTLRQAIMAWDMLSKVDVLCPDGDRDREARRLDELEAVARQRLKLSAKATLEKLREEVPPVLMTPEQAVRIVANAGGCKTDALAQWRGRAAFVADTSRQVLAGEARADRQWPRGAALDQPVRILVLGQRTDDIHGAAIWLRLENRQNISVRIALLATQLFAGLCTRLAVTGVPLEQGYAPREWLTLQPRASASVMMVRDTSCPRQARMNVGGAAVIDTGTGPRYWRFLLRGVGAIPDGKP